MVYGRGTTLYDHDPISFLFKKSPRTRWRCPVGSDSWCLGAWCFLSSPLKITWFWENHSAPLKNYVCIHNYIYILYIYILIVYLFIFIIFIRKKWWCVAICAVAAGKCLTRWVHTWCATFLGIDAHAVSKLIGFLEESLRSGFKLTRHEFGW